MINSGCLLAQESWMMDQPHIAVEAYAGHKGEETPRAFRIEGNRLKVVEYLDRWYTDTHCYFRVQADDERRYVLRHDLDQLRWELVMQEN